jgi:hypothetical protein
VREVPYAGNNAGQRIENRLPVTAFEFSQAQFSFLSCGCCVNICIGLVMGKTKAMAWNNVEYVAAYKLMRGVWKVASAFRYCNPHNLGFRDDIT